jgi:hypothetical protein
MRISEALSSSTGWNWSGNATLCGPSGAGTRYLSQDLAAIFAVAAIKRGVNARLIGSIIVGVLVFVGVWALNQWGARKLNHKIQELHRMEDDDE